MKIKFHKYEGAGNDFIMIDNRDMNFDKSNFQLIQAMCDRKKGIGADGLILLQTVEKYAFEMVYFNANGHIGSMCGNGGRCIVDFAKQLNIFDKECKFLACDGPHQASWSESYVSLRMQDVQSIECGEGFFYLDTGSPHYVKFVNDIESVNVFEEGQKIRYNERFKNNGTNVNFVQIIDKKLYVRTYERGVEDETLACGTGVVASVLSAFESGLISSQSIEVVASGGDLKVTFDKGKNYKNIHLIGSYLCVFKGEVIC
jgi:diaminopimelate epimerase